MARPRFFRLLEHQRLREDELRSELAAIEQRRQHELQAIVNIDRQRTQAAAISDPRLHEQYLQYCAACAITEQACRARLRSLDQQMALLREQLIEVWRRRRSLETLHERDAKQARYQADRREARTIQDQAARQWYLNRDQQIREGVQ